MRLVRSASRLPLAPLAALFSLAVSAIAEVASSDVCSRPIAMPMPMGGMSMSGMSMSGTSMASAGPVMLCPVVLALLAVSAALAAWALCVVCRDGHRTVTTAVLLRTLARLPVVPAFVALALTGAAAIAAIVAVDGGVPFDMALVATLATIVAGIALGAVLASLALARLILAFCERLAVALALALGDARCVPVRVHRPVAVPLRTGVLATASGRGLRAPPSTLR